MQALAVELADESFGPEMLEALGYYYELKAQQYLGSTKVRLLPHPPPRRGGRRATRTLTT